MNQHCIGEHIIEFKKIYLIMGFKLIIHLIASNQEESFSVFKEDGLLTSVIVWLSMGESKAQIKMHDLNQGIFDVMYNKIV